MRQWNILQSNRTISRCAGDENNARNVVWRVQGTILCIQIINNQIGFSDNCEREYSEGMMKMITIFIFTAISL